MSDEYRQPYLDGIRRDEASFFGMIANIDENMAWLERFLLDNGIRDNTVLIFMTDNGTATGQEIYNAGMRGRKTSLYEGGHRVPCFIRWPVAGLDGGRDVGGLTRGVDILPTLVDLCDLQAPEGWTCDGLSLASHLRRPDSAVLDRMSVVQYGHANEGVRFGFTGKDQAAVMWRNWRLVNGRELYNIGEDPGQQRDVAAANPELVKRLRDDYAAWWDGVSDTITTYQPLTIGAGAENPARLCSCDWAWVYADNQQGMRGPIMASGTWHVDAARPGLYDFTLRRWPEESGLGISDPAPIMLGVDGSWPAGKALPVSSVWLQVGRSDQTQPVTPDATSLTFRMALEQGPATVKSWWRDKEGSQLAGAYYLTAERLRE